MTRQEFETKWKCEYTEEVLMSIVSIISDAEETGQYNPMLQTAKEIAGDYRAVLKHERKNNATILS